jgi:hypothetical protein
MLHGGKQSSLFSNLVFDLGGNRNDFEGILLAIDSDGLVDLSEGSLSQQFHYLVVIDTVIHHYIMRLQCQIIQLNQLTHSKWNTTGRDSNIPVNY